MNTMFSLIAPFWPILAGAIAAIFGGLFLKERAAKNRTKAQLDSVSDKYTQTVEAQNATTAKDREREQAAVDARTSSDSPWSGTVDGGLHNDDGYQRK